MGAAVSGSIDVLVREPAIAASSAFYPFSKILHDIPLTPTGPALASRTTCQIV
jgi:hypothetical protein